MIAAALLVYVTQCVAGWLVWPAVAGARPAGAAGLGAVLLVGPAAVAVQMLAYGLLGVPFALVAVLAPWWAWLAVHVARQRRAGAPRRTAPVPGRRREPWALVAIAVALAPLGLAAAASVTAPVCDTDAMHNFAMPARVFASHAGLAADRLAGLADPGNLHSPPLLALNECLLFLVDEDSGAWLVTPFPVLALLAFVLLAAAAVWDPRRPRASCAVFAFVVLVPELVVAGARGYADLRFAATLLLLAASAGRLLRDRTAGRGAVAAVAAAAIAAGLTKAEGYAVAAAAALLLAWRGCAVREQRTACFVAVPLVAAAVAAWPCWAAAAELPVEYSVRGGADTLAAALVALPEALEGVLAATAAADAQGTPHWGWYWPVALGLGLWRAAVPADRAAHWLVAALGLHVMCLAFATACVAAGTGFPLDWVQQVTVQRLLLHALPWTVLLMPTAAPWRRA